MNVRIERVYGSKPKPGEYRVLVDRVWPRGESKATLKLDRWDRDVAPSTQLRKWFGHIPEKFNEFEKKYRAELDKNPATRQLKDALKTHENVVLLYGSKDEKHNQAVVLQKYLSRMR